VIDEKTYLFFDKGFTNLIFPKKEFLLGKIILSFIKKKDHGLNDYYLIKELCKINKIKNYADRQYFVYDERVEGRFQRKLLKIPKEGLLVKVIDSSAFYIKGNDNESHYIDFVYGYIVKDKLYSHKLTKHVEVPQEDATSTLHGPTTVKHVKMVLKDGVDLSKEKYHHIKKITGQKFRLFKKKNGYYLLYNNIMAKITMGDLLIQI
jgi:hypothetical protein